MIQQVLEESGWPERMTPRDLAALSPLSNQLINPYGRFELDTEARLPLDRRDLFFVDFYKGPLIA